MGTQGLGISLPTTGALLPVDPHHYLDLRRSREVQTGFERFCLLKHFTSLFQSPSATHSFPDSPARSCRRCCLVFYPHSSQSSAPSVFQEGQLLERTPTPCPSRRGCPLHLRFLSLRTSPPAPGVVAMTHLSLCHPAQCRRTRAVHCPVSAPAQTNQSRTWGVAVVFTKTSRGVFTEPPARSSCSPLAGSKADPLLELPRVPGSHLPWSAGGSALELWRLSCTRLSDPSGALSPLPLLLYMLLSPVEHRQF